MIAASGAGLVYIDHGKEIHAVRNATLEIHEREFVGILGPSGSGKSSLLYLLSGLKDPTSGRVEYRRRPYSELSDRQRSDLRLREFGFVFQQPFLIGYLSAIENVLLIDPTRKGGEADARRLLGELGIGDKLARMPAELSGGEKQRVCVARSLFARPRVVFADEPTASLDHAGGLQVVRLLREHLDGALVMVTHDPSMLEKADRVFAISEGIASENPAGVH
jgi:putative ABC transport system ATP-binding protein